MRVTVKLFAVVRERAGTGELQMELPEGATVGRVRDQLAGQAGVGALLGRVAWAVNREYASLEAVLADGDEVAVIPAVSGG